MDGEVIDALFGLLDQRVLEHFPVELGRVAVDLLQRLIDRHGADRHRGIAHDPAADVVDVPPGGQVHHGVGAPAGRPHQFFDFFGDAGGHGGIADIGVDLHQEVAADDDRLQFRVVDVGRNDGAAAGDLGANEFRCDERRNFGAETFAVGDARLGLFQRLRAAEVFAVRDVDHFLGDDAGAGEFILRHQLARLAAIDRQVGRTGRDQLVVADIAVVLGLHRAGGDALEAAFGEPFGAHRRQTGLQVDRHAGVGVGARAVVGAIRFLARCRIERDFTERHANVRPARRREYRSCASRRSGRWLLHSGGRRTWTGPSWASPHRHIRACRMEGESLVLAPVPPPA